jgi:xanthine/uracil permease
MPSATAISETNVAVSKTQSTDEFDIGVNERVPFFQALALGLQNIFGMAGMFVFPGLLGRAFHLPLDQMAYLYAVTFIVCGVITVFQSVFLLRLPIVQGPYAGSFAALLSIGLIKGSNLGAAYGSFCIAALIWCLLSIPIHHVSLISFFTRYFRSPLISGGIVILVVIQMSSVSLPNWIGSPATPGFPLISFGAGLVALLVLMMLTIWSGPRLRRFAILIALAIGTIAFSIFKPISLQAVLTAPWFVQPRWFPFGFGLRADYIAVFFLVLLSANMGSISLYQMVAGWSKESMPASRMSEGIFAVSLGSALAGVIGGFSTIAYPDNVGILRSTRIGSRYATLSAGLLLITFGGFIKFDFLLVLVPMPVLAAVATLLFGIVLVHGINILVKVEWNDRSRMVAGLALLVGLSGLFVSPDVLSAMPLTFQLILKQPIISGGLILVVLYSLLCRNRCTAAE